MFTWLSFVMSMMVSFCAVLFPTRFANKFAKEGTNVDSLVRGIKPYELGIFHANQTTKCLKNLGRTKGKGWSTAN